MLREMEINWHLAYTRVSPPREGIRSGPQWR